ncbi:DEKNAAC102179 [Brettanomyces naardenensis]|uniref:Mitochondrial distribution and morphology protein 12 n=1 Tax=Brettanomyces naardenensis TaxID=13370 RepID=A0A448YJV9_BRENA|nr:DEKNAAC102179 [Brettanomyces naardenensis]
MSFDINWDTIYTDASLRDSLKTFLNERLSSINLPNYMDNLQVVEVDLGSKSPQVSIRDIDYPFTEFYGDEEGQGSASSTMSSGQTRIRSKNNPSPERGQPISMSSGLTRSSSPSLSGRLGSPIPIGPTTGLLIPRPSSPYFQGLHNGVGIGAFGMKENDTVSQALKGTSDVFMAIPMDQNLSIDGVQEEPKPPVVSSPMKTRTNSQSTIGEGKEELDPNKPSSSRVPRGKNDIQMTVDIEWDSQIYIEVTCNLVVNYPSPEFITLPVRLKISDLLIHSLAVFAYLDHKVFISFLCDLDDNNTNVREAREDSRKSSVGDISGGFLSLDATRSGGGDRIDIIKDLKIEGELGDYEEIAEGGEQSAKDNDEDGRMTRNAMGSVFGSPSKLSAYSSNPLKRERQSVQQLGTTMTTTDSGTIAETSGNGSVLRNIGKIEKFLVSALRKMLISELAWPSWIELDLREGEGEGDDEEEGTEGEETEHEEEEEAEGADELDEPEELEEALHAQHSQHPHHKTPV